MSGTAGNHWAFSEQNNHLELAYRIANELGEPKENLDDLIKFLTSASAKELSKYSTCDLSDNIFNIPTGPVVESKVSSGTHHACISFFYQYN